MRDRIAGAASGLWNGWFGPDQPLRPIAPPEDVAGRRFDYPYGVNLAYAPRQEQGQAAVPFEILRAIADPAQGGLDLLRGAIEKRKRQMSKLRWKVQGKDDSDGGPRARALEDRLQRPDGQRSFRRWQRMLLEDHFVIDAVALYPRTGGDWPMMDPVDGATIKRVIDKFGRTPLAPFPAYQQFLKGVPAIDYTMDELHYFATTERTDHIYGYSRVEQVIGIVSIALNRQLSIASYYTKGSIPEMLIEMPPTLTSSTQIKEFDAFWQSLLSGQQSERWKARMIPAGAKAVFSKDAILKDAFDEWLARIICWVFDLPPTSLVKETNRSVSETQKEAAEEEGLESTKADFKEILDEVIALGYGEPDLEFAYDEEEVVDQEANAKIVVSLRGGDTGNAKPIITLDEARDRLGLDALTPEQRDELEPEPVAPAPGADPAAPGQPGAGNGTGTPAAGSAEPKTANDLATKARRSRAGRSLHGHRPNQARLAAVASAIQSALLPHLSAMGQTIVGTLRHKRTEVSKIDDSEIERLLKDLDPKEWRAIEDLLKPILAEHAKVVAGEAARALAAAAPLDHRALDALLHQSNMKAADWALTHAAELVTEISETTRTGLRELAHTAVEEGWTNEQLAGQISDSALFSDARAMRIARTEAANAENAGVLTSWKESGVVEGKEWEPDAEACEICLDNAAAGVIGIDDTFPSGDDAPTAHPNCECGLSAVLVSPAEIGA